jgi:uncharacterized protein
MAGAQPDYDGLFALFEQAGVNIRDSTALLRDLMRSWPDGADGRHRLVDIEHRNDAVTHDIIHHLHTAAAVPFDRRDALALASGLDDVVDYAEEAGDFLFLYRVEAPTDQAIELADTLAAAGAEVAAALGHLDEPPAANAHLDEIDGLEHEGDRILREALTALFDGGIDPMVVIRWKDIYERVEQAIDACDTVAHTLRGIAVRQA